MSRLNVESRAYLNVYQVLDEVCFADAVPAGARGLMYSSIDGLRQVHAPAEHIALAEDISLSLHRLEWPTQNGDAEEVKQLREELQTIGATWLQTPLRLAALGAPCH